ncbi:MAG TPA: hypothetical protein VLA43_00465 [Longimicrobiales bacterium]|nr:hypothetical protein [Longimicrobiales bacterium]
MPTPLRLIILVSAGVVAILLAQRFVASPPTIPESSLEPRREPTAEIEDWEQVTVTYFGDPYCQGCSDDGFKAELRATLSRLEETIKEQGRTFRAVGVSLSGPPRVALDFLESSGQWDEISIGGGWLNTKVADMIWASGLPPLTPTLVLRSETVSRSPSGDILVSPSNVQRSTVTFSGRVEVATAGLDQQASRPAVR